MKAEILCVGTEILLGDITNTNATYISKALAEFGVNVYYHTVVGDNKKRIYDSMKACLERCDLLLVTGGLGATYDDITKEVASEVFGRELVFNSSVLKEVQEYFKAQGRAMSPNCQKQAFIPEGAVILKNEKGTAPALMLEDKQNNKTAILMPGVPAEMRFITDTYVVPYIQKLSDTVLFSEVINFFGIGESALEQRLSDIMKSSLNPTVAPYAKTGEAIVRLTARAETKEKARAIISPIKKEIYSRLSEYIYAENAESLESVLVDKLKKHNKKIATAESCTGGLISKRITDVSGASQVFECGICSYSDRIKNKILKVGNKTLLDYTAVSKQTAKEMAQGVRKLSGADIAISSTGVAGPGDLSDTQPCGLVFIGIDSEDFSEVLELHLGGDKQTRSRIRHIATSWGIYRCIRLLEGKVGG